MKTPTPGEVRFELEAKLLSLANERGMIPLIMDVHSIVLLGDNRVSVVYDVVPDDDGGCGLLFEFAKPQTVAREDLGAFARWLAWAGRDETLH